MALSIAFRYLPKDALATKPDANQVAGGFAMKPLVKRL
jgi:hypothetical protein